MSLARLLSAGKSLVGGMDNTIRYRMGNPGMLPKFGSGKNPFRSGAKRQEPAARRMDSGRTRGSIHRRACAAIGTC